MRLSALRFPSLWRGGKLKAHLARRRENAGAWLFEIVKGIQDSAQRAARYVACRPSIPRPSFRGARLRANPESITTVRGYGFRACAQEGASRNDARGID